MSLPSRIRAWARRHPDLAELVAGLAAATAVTGLALVQWGPTDEGWVRGISLGVVLGIVVAAAVRRDRRRAEARERAAAEEHRRLARELHDSVAGQVGIIGIQAAAARRVLADQPERATEALEVIEGAARAANADLRRMLATLRTHADVAARESPVPPLPAPPGLADLPALLTGLRAAGLRIQTTGLDDLPRLPPSVDSASYRIVQESLTNALAHAGRVTATVTLTVAGGVLQVQVENEPGTPTHQHRGGGLGLRGMRERAERLGGRLEAGPRPRGGFAVVATLPVDGH